MLKKNITYTDFNGDEITETFYFHLAKNEIVELDLRFEGGLQGMIRRLMGSSDAKFAVEEFKRIILLTFGEKSDDGKRFIKSEELRKGFEQSAAFDELYMEMLTEENAAADFIIGALPKDVSKAALEAGKNMPPPSPGTTVILDAEK